MYIPLNIITDYSLLSSLIKVEDLVKKAKELGFKAIGVSDNNLCYVMEFYNECLKNDIKPIIGYKTSIEEKDIYLYAKNYNGYQNLCYISSNDISLDLIKNNIEGLFCVLPKESINFYNKLNIPDTYVGYTDSKLDNYKNIYFNKIKCFEKEDEEYLKYLELIKTGKNIDEKVKVEENVYFKKVEEIKLDKYDKELFEEIYNMVDIKIIKNDLLPKYSYDNNFDEVKYLENLCKKGLLKRFDNKVPMKYANRLMNELSVIDKMGFSNYFLVVWDYVKYAKKNNILVGEGRGSAAGSLVSYSLGITDVDPIKYDLFFERFLNPERVTMPDIDIDFEADRRDEVVDYLNQKYDNKRCANIIAFGTLKTKMVLRDVSRIFNMESKMDSFIKLFDRKLSLEENLKLKRIEDIYKKDTMLSRICDISLKLEGLKRTITRHAAGVIISKESLDRYIPLIKTDDMYTCAYTKEYPESLGLLKMDILAVDNLTLISNIVNEVGNIDLRNIPLDDKKTLDVFKMVETDGIFQFETPIFKNILRKISVNSFDDLAAIIALDRPGAIDNVDIFKKRKEGKEKIDYIDDSLKPILSSTYGIILYQEQIMQIASKMASFSLGEADILRRAMSKKNNELMLKQKEKFVNNSINNGYSEEIANKVFNYIYKFAEYGFNKSHSVCYAIISYKMAYLKSHYTNYYMKYLLNMVIGNEFKTKQYINECKLKNIEVLKPDINKSESEFVIENNRIRFSLSSIKNIGTTISNKIIEERKNGLYKDFLDFVSRTYKLGINKKILPYLIYSGAFDSFNYNKKTLIENIDLAINYAELCTSLDSSMIEKPEFKVVDEFTKDELVKLENNTFGFYLSNHPVQNKRNNDIDTRKIKDNFNKNIDIYLLVDNKKEIITKNKEKMLFITGSDEYSEIELVMFPKVYEKYYNISKGDIIKFNTVVEKRGSTYQLIINKLEKL